jgi:hypothetical protein
MAIGLEAYQSAWPLSLSDVAVRLPSLFASEVGVFDQGIMAHKESPFMVLFQ